MSFFEHGVLCVVLISNAALRRFYASLRTNADEILKSQSPVCDCTLLAGQALHRTDSHIARPALPTGPKLLLINTGYPIQ